MAGLLDFLGYGSGGLTSADTTPGQALQRILPALNPFNAEKAATNPEVLAQGAEQIRRLREQINPLGSTAIAAEQERAKAQALQEIAARFPVSPPLLESEYGRPPAVAPAPAAAPAVAVPGMLAAGKFGTLAPPMTGGADPGVNPVKTQAINAPVVPPNAAPAVGTRGPPVAAPVPAPLPRPTMDGQVPPSLFGRVGNFLGNNSNTLMQLGAGLAGAPGWAKGIQAGLQGASVGRQLDSAQQGENQTAGYLQKKLGITAEEAIAVAKNPNLMRSILPELGSQTEVVPIKNASGDTELALVNKREGTVGVPGRMPPIGATRQIGGQTYIFTADKGWVKP